MASRARLSATLRRRTRPLARPLCLSARCTSYTMGCHLMSTSKSQHQTRQARQTIIWIIACISRLIVIGVMQLWLSSRLQFRPRHQCIEHICVNY